MKIFSTLIAIFWAFTAFAQPLNFQLDTVQILQNSDVGSVAFADINADGDQDVVITGSPGITTLYKNDGIGNFTAVTSTLINVYSGAAKFADVDNDGDIDLLITGNTSAPAATANLYLNDGLGNFTVSAGSLLEPSNSGDVDFGDIDGDNDLDVLMTGLDASGAVFTKLYVNDGVGAFTVVSGTNFIPAWKSAVEFVDVDNDNDLDVIICGADAADIPTASLYTNDGIGSFTLISGTPFEGVEFGDVSIGDTDNDGDQDVFISGSNSNGLAVANIYENTGTGFSLIPNTPFPGTSLHSSALADFNNDGKVDLLHIGNSSSGLIGHVYQNLGGNTFVLSDSTIRGSYNGSNAVADFNGNGKLDIITTGTSFTAPVRAPKIYFNQSLSLSANDFSAENAEFSIFPNPSNGYINIQVNSLSPAQMDILDLTGRLVLRKSFSTSIQNVVLNHKPGVFLVRLTVDNQVYIQKVIVK